MSRPKSSTMRYSGYRDETLQASVLAHLDRAGHKGMTVMEIDALYDADTEAHHGWISGALSMLHRDLKIARLTERRAGCRVYVERDFLDNRPCEAQGNGARLSKDEVEQLAEAKEFFDYWFTVDSAGAKFGTDRTRAERNQRLFFSQARVLFGDSVNL